MSNGLLWVTKEPVVMFVISIVWLFRRITSLDSMIGGDFIDKVIALIHSSFFCVSHACYRLKVGLT